MIDMGIPVLILGDSGSGKSTSLRNFEPGQIGIFNVAGKPLPFRKKLDKIDGASYDKILRVLARAKLKAYVIDDSQYLMAFEFFDRATEKGYDKFTNIAVNFRNLVDFVIRKTPENCIVYFLHHIETEEGGKVKAKTLGKMLDNQLTLEGLFSIVLLCKRDQNGYRFITQSDGFSTAKSPMDMFEESIDNDLALVDARIRDYWFGGTGNEECELGANPG